MLVSLCLIENSLVPVFLFEFDRELTYACVSVCLIEN